MTLPEPEFKITVFQLENILKELEINTEHLSKDRVELTHLFRKKCFEHLDSTD